MLTINEVRNLLGDTSSTDEEIAGIRDACHALAELVVEAWRDEASDFEQ